jgi:hypothetical protein
VDHEIIAAIENKRLIKLDYDGHRILEPHAYGLDRKGIAHILVFQIEGESRSGEMSGWKFLNLNSAKDIRILTRSFPKARSEFQRGDKRFKKFYAEI